MCIVMKYVAYVSATLAAEYQDNTKIRLSVDSVQDTRKRIEIFFYISQEYSVIIQETDLTNSTWLY